MKILENVCSAESKDDGDTEGGCGTLRSKAMANRECVDRSIENCRPSFSNLTAGAHYLIFRPTAATSTTFLPQPSKRPPCAPPPRSPLRSSPQQVPSSALRTAAVNCGPLCAVIISVVNLIFNHLAPFLQKFKYHYNFACVMD